MDEVSVVVGVRPPEAPPPGRRKSPARALVWAGSLVLVVAGLALSGSSSESTGPGEVLAPPAAIPAPLVEREEVAGPTDDPLASGWRRIVLAGQGGLTAVAAVEDGWVALGPGPSGWWSADGLSWNGAVFGEDVASLSSLVSVAAHERTVVAAGADPGGRLALIVSEDGGRRWRAPSGSLPPEGAVLDLAHDGGGFLAVGHRGPEPIRQAMAWRSPDGDSWTSIILEADADDSIAGAVAATEIGTLILGGGASGPLGWIEVGPAFEQVELRHPEEDRSWGRIDIVDAERDGDVWLVLTRSRLGGWGRVALTADGLGWEWQSQSFDSRSLDLMPRVGGLLLAGPSPGGWSLSRPGLVHLKPVVEGGEGGTMRTGTVSPDGEVLVVGESGGGDAMVWLHGWRGSRREG